jgi:protein-S-isoprenylcysteine O-methyltransferase Ste14
MSAHAAAVVALALFGVFGALGFGWRSWVQRRRTGSTGFRGVSGRPGSLEWFAGIGFVIALVAAVAAPLLQVLGAVSPLVSPPWVHTAGIVVAVVGIAATVYAQIDMGDSWRIGVDRGETTTLVRRGVFGWVRNPIFTAMLVFGLGIALVTPNVVAIVGFVLLVVTIELQVRLVEEPYLVSVHGDSYRDYLAGVGRFVPGVGVAPGYSCGTSRSISSSQVRADMSDGARQSPRGDSDPPCDTLGPLGNADRLNWLNE